MTRFMMTLDEAVNLVFLRLNGNKEILYLKQVQQTLQQSQKL